MIRVNNISVQKGGKRLLKDLSFELKPGQIAVVLGKNGAGKSTLLETLTGMNPVVEGWIDWDHRPLSNFSLAELAQKRAVLSQQTSIQFPIRVSELVEMGSYAAVPGTRSTQVKAWVDEALEIVEMQYFRSRFFHTLSGGEQKRVMLAKCLVQLSSVPHNNHTERYLFLDEPTASLDLHQQHKLIALIKRLVASWKLGVFAILHDINLAAQLADQILMLKSGRLLYQGSPEETLTPERLRDTLGIHSQVQCHPVLGCPYIMAMPEPLLENHHVHMNS